jgi:hypothetical protein
MRRRSQRHLDTRTAPGIEFGMDWAPITKTEQGSASPYTYLRSSRCSTCWRGSLAEGFTTGNLRTFHSCMYFPHFACRLWCRTSTRAAIPSCIFLLSLLPPPQSIILLAFIARNLWVLLDIELSIHSLCPADYFIFRTPILIAQAGF